ncbi:hypothetical protein [Microvirga sp. TS319]|uniref:hypothetical protein n=1 Tax=Microvirga sp. TS319 TaxID=3241165 RepID=UPI00351A2CAB
MAIRLHCIGNVSLALGLIAGASTGYAQSSRAWVDPPPEAGAASSSAAAPAISTSKPAAPHPPATDGNAASKTDAANRKQALQGTDEASPSVGEEKPAAKTQPRKTVRENRDRRQQTRTAARGEPSIRSRRTADRISGPSRADRVREGINSGLEVMTLRTIEFPDGRRVQILTRPHPEAMSGLMEAPE